MLSRITFVVAAILGTTILTACSTPGDLKAQRPSFVFDSVRDSKATAGCIADDLSEKYHRLGNTVSSRVTSNGYVVQYDPVSPFGKMTAMLIEVTDLPNGKSRVTGYLDSGLRSYAMADAENAASRCSK